MERRLRRIKAVRQATVPIRTDIRGVSRLVTPPWKMEATRPIYPSSLPFFAEVNWNRSYVMKDSDVSIPEKNKRNTK